MPRRTEFEKDHKKYHKRRHDPAPESSLEKFHDHYATEDDHNDPGHAGEYHSFHSGHRMALVGNPNCGKTTLFNYLTGSSQYVGNWPGVTVEKKEGKSRMGGENLSIVDLPGIYSLAPYTSEEIIARNYIIDEQPELIINIVDATNLERNLYLTTQLLELGRPMIVALNMVDMLRRRGDSINIKLLSKRLGVPVMPVSASKGEGVMELMHKAHKYAEEKILPITEEIYSGEVLDIIAEIEKIIAEKSRKKGLPLRWSAVKLFECDEITQKRLRLDTSAQEMVSAAAARIPLSEHTDRDMLIADSRYKWICGVCEEVCDKRYDPFRPTISDRIDAIVTNKYAAIPLFLAIMGFIFWLTFGSVGAFLSDMTGRFVDGVMIPGVRGLLEALGASGWAVSMVCDGALAGIGAVLSFLPQVAVLFLCLSVLEDSGYMARAAFIMDKPLRRIGLSGKSFVPMLMGFGCTVPAVMSTRTLESEKDKRATIMILPFMSCSAKLPVYAMIIAAFFPQSGAPVMIGMYLLGIAAAVLSAMLINKAVIKGEAAAFVMELPGYHLPTPRGLWIHIWERLRDFITKAGSVILGATIVVWVLQSFTPQFAYTTDSTGSILAAIGTFIAPVFKWAGFGDWKYSVAILTGFIGKEQVVSTMRVICGSEAAVGSALAADLSPAAALAFLAFVLLYTPCMAAVGAIFREMKSWRLALLTIGWGLAAAWLVSTGIYQIGTLIMR